MVKWYWKLNERIWAICKKTLRVIFRVQSWRSRQNLGSQHLLLHWRTLTDRRRCIGPSLKFGVSIIWRQLQNHVNDCHICCTRILNISSWTKHGIAYLSIPSAIRPVGHDDEDSRKTLHRLGIHNLQDYRMATPNIYIFYGNVTAESDTNIMPLKNARNLKTICPVWKSC